MGRSRKYFTETERREASRARLQEWRIRNPDVRARENTTGEYFYEMKRAMGMLADDPRTLFLFQDYGRIGLTLADVPEEKKIDLPVIEDAQMGFAIGLSLAGFVPISCYVRWPFLLLAANQLVNHLDKLEQMSDGGYKPKVLIRVGVGSTRPLDPGCQAIGDYTAAFRSMLTTVNVVTLNTSRKIVPAYAAALRSAHSTILIEYGNSYEKRPSQIPGEPHIFPCGCRGVLPLHTGESNLFACGIGRTFSCRISQILVSSNHWARQLKHVPVNRKTPHSLIRRMMGRPNCVLCGGPLSWSVFRTGETPALHHNHGTGEIYGFTHSQCNLSA